MPYAIRKVGGKYCLFLKESGKRVGCHDSKEEAIAQRAAIEIRKHARMSSTEVATLLTAEEARDDHGRWSSGGDSEAAVAAVDKLPAGYRGGDDSAENPLFTPEDDIADHYSGFNLDVITPATETTIKSVPISKIDSDQATISRNQVKGYLSGTAGNKEIDGSAREANGRFYLLDGNHRVVAAKLRGSKNVRLKVAPAEINVVDKELAKHAASISDEVYDDLLARLRTASFDMSQPRDEHGRWLAGAAGLKADASGDPTSVFNPLVPVKLGNDEDENEDNIMEHFATHHAVAQDFLVNDDRDTEGMKNAPGDVRDIPIASVVSSQQTLSRAKVQEYIDKGLGEEPVGVAVRHGRKFLMVDGNHRVVAAALRGEKTVRLKVVKDFAKPKYSAAAGVPRGITFREHVGPTRTESFQGKDYVVLPIIALVEGVIWPINSAHPNLVPETALRVAPSNWDGRPVMADGGHPVIDGEQVSANTPDMLKTAIGMVFHARVEGKRLLMEAWIDPTLPAAQLVLQRVAAGELVEVSVGVLVIEEPTTGVWEGKPFFGIWRVILPDHLAILPEGDEGACSGSMGCGIRAATKRVHLVTAAGVELTEEARVKLTDEKMQTFLKTAVDAADPFKELHTLDESACVYETAAGKTYRQAYEAADETVKLVGDRMEVEPIIYYEPTGVDLKTAKGARHSQTDMARIQAMHDHTVDLGAQCAAAPKAAAAAPCGCKHKENAMARTAEQRTALIASLKTKLKDEVFTKLSTLAGAKGGDIINAIIAQIKDKLGLSDAAAADIANLDEATIVELAGFATQEAAEPNEPATADAALATAAAALATAAVKKETEVEFLGRNPELARIVAAARSRNDARKAHLVGVLKTAQTHFKESDLLKMDLDKLEEVAVLCKANVVADVDFGAAAPRATNEEAEDGVSPEPIDLGARIKAARAKK